MANPLELNGFYAPDRAAWRSWLEEHHATEREGVWLIYYKQHKGKSCVAYNDSVEEALCFGWVDSLIRRLDEDRYARKFTPRKPDSDWSESNRKRVRKLMGEGLMTDAGLRLVEAAKRSGRWDMDARATVSDEPPSAFVEALESEPRAARHYEGMTAAQRRQFAQWINAAKRPDTRDRRIRESIGLLCAGRKLGMK